MDRNSISLCYLGSNESIILLLFTFTLFFSSSTVDLASDKRSELTVQNDFFRSSIRKKENSRNTRKNEKQFIIYYKSTFEIRTHPELLLTQFLSVQ